MGLGAERLAEGVVVLVVQMGEEEETTGVVPRAEESTVVQWAGAANKSMVGVVQGLEPELRPCFPSYRALLVSIATGAHAHNFNYLHLPAHAYKALSKIMNNYNTMIP